MNCYFFVFFFPLCFLCFLIRVIRALKAHIHSHILREPIQDIEPITGDADHLDQDSAGPPVFNLYEFSILEIGKMTSQLFFPDGELEIIEKKMDFLKIQRPRVTMSKKLENCPSDSSIPFFLCLSHYSPLSALASMRSSFFEIFLSSSIRSSSKRSTRSLMTLRRMIISRCSERSLATNSWIDPVIRSMLWAWELRAWAGFSRAATIFSPTSLPSLIAIL